MGIMSIIEKKIESKSMKYGIMGTESVNISLELTEEQMEEFLALDLSDNYTYELEGNNLFITFREDV